MNDQRKHWNLIHEKDNLNHHSDPTDFALEALKLIKPNSIVLELGCGAGNDSIAFAKTGHRILATDFAEVVVRKNKERFCDVNNLNFEVLDISKPMAFKESSFDAIYSRLSLHYFTDAVTRKIFKELHRILKPNGYLFFVCKSIQDPLYGQGERIEKDMYEKNGHIRHFFSGDYARTCLERLFKIEELKEGKENFYDSPSAFIKVVARKN